MITTRVLTPLILRAIDGDRWIVEQEFRVMTARLGLIVVEAGRPTDLNSTPRLFWNVLPPSEYAEAAAAHDKLYQDGRLNGVVISRADADEVHRELVAWAGGPDDPASRLAEPRQPAPAWKRDVFHRGLRWFGGLTWAKYRRADRPRAATAAAV
jgi:hypothetical protein